jgi:hypothetical protein
MMGLIYMATNTINGKQYIGQTMQSLAVRKGQHHRKPAKSSYAFGQAILKYGKKAFTWTILHDGILDDLELDRLEMEEIKKRKTIAPHGYNIREGGNGGTYRGGRYGVLTDENRRRLIPVICIETGIRYDGMRAAASAIKSVNSHIRECCDNPTRTCKGYHFRYADDARHEKAKAEYYYSIRKLAEEKYKRKMEAANKPKPKKPSKMNSQFHQEARRKRAEAQAKREAREALIKAIGKDEYDRKVREEAKRRSILLVNDPNYQARFKEGMRKRSRHPMSV